MEAPSPEEDKAQPAGTKAVPKRVLRGVQSSARRRSSRTVFVARASAGKRKLASDTKQKSPLVNKKMKKATMAPVTRTPLQAARLHVSTVPAQTGVASRAAASEIPIAPATPTPLPEEATIDNAGQAALIRGMESRLGGKMDGVDLRVHALEDRLDKGDDEFEDRVISIINKVNAPPPSAARRGRLCFGWLRLCLLCLQQSAPHC